MKNEGFMERFEAGFGKWVVKHRWLIIVATIAAVLIASRGMRFLTFNNDSRVFFSEQNPQLQALEALENTYTKDNNVFFVLAPRDGDVFTRETLTAVEELTEESWKIPHSSRVDSLSNFQHTWAEEDDLIVEDLVLDAEDLSEEDLERIRGIALAEPLLVSRLISTTGHVTGVNVTMLLPGESMDEVVEVAKHVRELADNIREKYPDIDVYISGGVMFDNAFSEASEHDMRTLIPIMFVVLIIFIGVFLRSIVGTISTLIIILISMTTGLGLAGWLGISITVASVNAPTLILTLAVADSVHILTLMLHQIHMGKAKHEAIAESLRVNLRAVFITSATTAIGFLSMNFSDAPPFRDLGNIVAMGVMAAFIYSVLFLPSLMAVLPLLSKPRDKSSCCSCDSLASFVINRRQLVFWGTLALIAVVSIGISHIELNDNFAKYFSKRYDIRTSNDFMEENLTGLDVIEYSLDSGEPGGINNPEYLAKADEFVEWYRKQAKVLHVYSITDTMKRLNKNMHGDDESWHRIPEERDLAAQYLLLYEMSLPFGLDLNNKINVDKSATRMTVTVKEMTHRELREMDEKARGWLKANAPESMFSYGSGLAITWAHISGRNIKSMLWASFLALVLISAVLVLALGSLKLGLVSLVPNLTPAVMAFGIWGFMIGQVGLGLSVIVSMTIGIVVDDTIHFLSKYLRARRENSMDPQGAVRYSFNAVGTAMWITTVALIAGFLVISSSSYKMNSDMGMMTAITIAFALAMDFFLLPTLLMKIER